MLWPAPEISLKWCSKEKWDCCESFGVSLDPCSMAASLIRKMLPWEPLWGAPGSSSASCPCRGTEHTNPPARAASTKSRRNFHRNSSITEQDSSSLQCAISTGLVKSIVLYKINLQRLNMEEAATVLWGVLLQLLLSGCIYWFSGRVPCLSSPSILCIWSDFPWTRITQVALLCRASSLALELLSVPPSPTAAQSICSDWMPPLPTSSSLHTECHRAFLLFISHSSRQPSPCTHTSRLFWTHCLQFCHLRDKNTKNLELSSALTTGSYSTSTKAARLQKENNYGVTFILKSSGILLWFRTITFQNSVHQPLESLSTSLFCSTCETAQLNQPWDTHGNTSPALHSSQNFLGNVYQTLFKLLPCIQLRDAI